MNEQSRSGCGRTTAGCLIGLVLLPLLAILGYVTLRSLGAYLIVADRQEQADAVVVLSGGDLDRLDTAVEIIREEQARYLILTDTDEMADSGRRMTDYLYSEATLRGVTVPQIDITNHTVTTTGDEARAVRQLMEERGWQSCIVVTDPYHSRRTRFLFRQAFAGSGVSVMVTPVSGSWYRSGTWFLSREGWSITAKEWGKLIATWMGVQ